MLTELTPEQQALMPIIRDKWINKLNKPKQFEKEKAIKAVEWLYEFSKLEKPKVIVCESPLACQLAMNLLWVSVRNSVNNSVRNSVWVSVWNSVWNSVNDSVWDSVNDSVNNSVWNSVRNSVNDSVWNSVRDSVWASVWDSVRASVWDSVRDSVNDSVWNSVRNSVNDSVEASELRLYSTSINGDYSDFGWTAFYDFFKEIGIIYNSNFEKWLEYCEVGIFYSIQYKGVCAICPGPKYVKRNDSQAMHCEDGFAIEWADGYGIYVLDGIRFDRKGQDQLYWKIVKHKLTLPEILAIEDIDQRAIALKYCNAEAIISDLVANNQANLIDEATKKASYLEHNSVEFIDGIAQIDFLIEKPTMIEKQLSYKLYRVNIPEILEDEYMLVFNHASVDGLSYWKGVHPNDAKLGSIGAIAKYHNMSVDEYLLATAQS